MSWGVWRFLSRVVRKALPNKEKRGASCNTPVVASEKEKIGGGAFNADGSPVRPAYYVVNGKRVNHYGKPLSRDSQGRELDQNGTGVPVD